jgi:hypothetical protein
MGRKPKRRRPGDEASGDTFGPQTKRFLLIAAIITVVLLILIYTAFIA